MAERRLQIRQPFANLNAIPDKCCNCGIMRILITSSKAEKILLQPHHLTAFQENFRRQRLLRPPLEYLSPRALP